MQETESVDSAVLCIFNPAENTLVRVNLGKNTVESFTVRICFFFLSADLASKQWQGLTCSHQQIADMALPNRPAILLTQASREGVLGLFCLLRVGSGL
jgi:hypothetical protein